MTGVNLTESFEFSFNMGLSTWQMLINDESSVWFEVNVVAVFFIIYIEKLKKLVGEHMMSEKINSIGQPEQEL